MAIVAAAGAILSSAGIVAADTTATWGSGVSGSWTSTTAWSIHPNYPQNGAPSGVDYQALINAAGGTAYTVTLNSTVSVDGLTLNSNAATLGQTAGTFTTNTLDINAGSYFLEGGAASLVATTMTVGLGAYFYEYGGTLSCPSVSAANQVYIDGGTLNGVHATSGNLTQDSEGELVTITDGLSGNGLNSAQFSDVSFNGGSQTVDDINLSTNSVVPGESK
jgi:hypothetical protein